jgi:hypothetical protein
MKVIEIDVNSAETFIFPKDFSHLFATESRTPSKHGKGLFSWFLLDDFSEAKINKNRFHEVWAEHDIFRFNVEMYYLMMVHQFEVVFEVPHSCFLHLLYLRTLFHAKHY